MTKVVVLLVQGMMLQNMTKVVVLLVQGTMLSVV